MCNDQRLSTVRFCSADRPRRLAVFVVVSVAMCFPARAQTAVVQPSREEAALTQAYRSMYNLNFQEAFRQAESAKAVAKDDPLPWIAEACAVLFREFDRLHILRSEMFASDKTFESRAPQSWTPESKAKFDQAIAGAEKLAQARLARNKNDVDALFALALANGLQADNAALIGKKNMAALSFVKTANSYAERLLARAPDYYDAYVSTGMGKYIIGGKAAPVRWILRLEGLKGDQEEGIKELKLAAEHGHYLAPFARILLAFDDLRHEKKSDARQIFSELRSQFPGNPLFAQEIAELDHSPMGPGQ